jgi:hypothetical protein
VLKRQVGNFPQAFSHVSLINTAYRLSGHDVEPIVDKARHPTVAALGAPMVNVGRAGRHPWRMWGAGRVAADGHPEGEGRLHLQGDNGGSRRRAFRRPPRKAP